MIITAPSDIAFDLFGIPVYWYGIIMAIAIFAAIIAGNKLYNIVNKKLRPDVILEYAPIIIMFGIFGARLYFCLLNHDYYFANPVEILDIRQGGLSIHGAILGGVLSMALIAYKLKLPLACIADSLSCSTILGQSIGRWGNFFNSEAYGLPVEGQKWGVFIPEAHRVSKYSDYTLFHPTFLYESVLDFLAFFVLMFILLKFGGKYRGITFFSYLTIYSVIRFFIERIRVDSALNLGSLPIAELISVCFFIIGMIGIFAVLIKRKGRV